MNQMDELATCAGLPVSESFVADDVLNNKPNRLWIC
jgi:hypothetical protein